MKMLLLLLAVSLLQGSAQGQTPEGPRLEPPVLVFAVKWGDHPVMESARHFNSYVQPILRLMSVTVTNAGTRPIESLRVAFVFSDPDTGEEWFRYKVRRKKRLLPGESVLIEKGATPTLGVPARDELASKSAVVTEVIYADGSVWRSK